MPGLVMTLLMENQPFLLTPYVFALACCCFSSPTLVVADNSVRPLTVYVVNYPLQYFAQRIAGEHAKVMFPAPSATEPAVWMPEPETIMAYQQADLILLNGASYAKWTDTASLPRSRQVHTSADFADRYIHIENTITHRHGPEGEHAHAGTAFTTWLDFEPATLQAKAIAEALERKRPSLREVFQHNFAALEKDLKALDREMKALVVRKPNLPLIASQPVYQYLAHQYQLNLKSVHWEPDEVPTEEQWQELEALLETHAAQWMIWEGPPLAETVTRLETNGLTSVVFDPCSQRPSQGDFLNVMQQNIQSLAGAWGE